MFRRFDVCLRVPIVRLDAIGVRTAVMFGFPDVVVIFRGAAYIVGTLLSGTFFAVAIITEVISDVTVVPGDCSMNATVVSVLSGLCVPGPMI